MLAMTLFVVPGGFGLVVWWSYRSARRRAGGPDAFVPQGKRRWPEQTAGRNEEER